MMINACTFTVSPMSDPGAVQGGACSRDLASWRRAAAEAAAASWRFRITSACIPRGSDVFLLVLTCFLLRDSGILPKKNLQSSLWVDTLITEGLRDSLQPNKFYSGSADCASASGRGTIVRKRIGVRAWTWNSSSSYNICQLKGENARFTRKVGVSACMQAGM